MNAESGYRIGIQGGRGSFTEEALHEFQRRGLIPQHIQPVYLFTSQRVADEVTSGSVTSGIMALCNVMGKKVAETQRALTTHSLTEIAVCEMPIRHALMIRTDATPEDIQEIWAHPQVFAQCAHTLKNRYPKLEQIVGVGDLIDHALVAELLSKGTSPISQDKTLQQIAVMGSANLANINENLQVIDTNLQDLGERNLTTFVLVGR